MGRIMDYGKTEEACNEYIHLSTVLEGAHALKWTYFMMVSAKQSEGTVRNSVQSGEMYI